MVVGEVSYLVGERMGPIVEAGFLAAMADMVVLAPEQEDWPRIAELARRYADFPLGGTDASVVTLAERLGTEYIMTFDHRHFRAIRPRHCAGFRLLP